MKNTGWYEAAQATAAKKGMSEGSAAASGAKVVSKAKPSGLVDMKRSTTEKKKMTPSVMSSG